jgi:hypothetical protein
VLHGGSWAARDIEDSVGEEKRACFNGVLGFGEVESGMWRPIYYLFII